MIFLLFNPRGRRARLGCGDPTDTAFLVGALAIIAPKYPAARLRTFLLTLAVVDDIGALIAIAVFYLERIRVVPLLVAVGLLFACWPCGICRPAAADRRIPFRRWPVVVVVRRWVHPTLAGVAVALLIPVFTRNANVEAAVEVIRAFRQSPNSEYARAATRSLRDSISINERLLTGFGPYVSFGVLPVFALANAGVHLDRHTIAEAAGRR